MPLPTTRTTANTAAVHVADHNDHATQINANTTALAAKAFLPHTDDHVVYVSKGASASDANDGLTAYSAKATPQAAANALPGNFSGATGGGRIVILHGDYTGGLNITTPRTTVEFIGEGARLSGSGMASGKAVLRIAASRCKVIGGWVHDVPANGYGVMVNVNATADPVGSTVNTSNENTNIIGTFVDSLGANAVAFGIGPDTTYDVSETTLIGCSSVGNGSTSVHMKLGGGGTGNVLDTTNVGGNSQGHKYGLWIAGGSITSTGMCFQSSAVADIFLDKTPVGNIAIKGGRSENAFRFLLSSLVQFALPIAIEDYYVANIQNTDGKGVLLNSEAPIAFQGITLTGATVPQQFFVRQMQGSPASGVPAIVHFTHCWSDHPRPFGPLTERPGYLRTVVGGGQISTVDIQPAAGTSHNLRRDTVQRQTAAATYTFDAACASSFVVLLDRNCTAVTITHPKMGQVVTLEYVQNGVGGWTYVWPTNVGFAGNAAPTASTTARDSDSVTMRWTGSFWREINRAVAVRPPAGVAVALTDNFTGVDDFRPLTATATGGGTWEHLLGVMGRASNKAAPVLVEQSLGDANQNMAYTVAVVDRGVSTGTVQADVTYQAGYAGLVFNATDEKDFLLVVINATVMQTWCFINGDVDTVTTNAFAHTVGATYTLKVVVTATGFQIYENSVLKVNVADWTTDARYKKLRSGRKYGLVSSSLLNRFDAFDWAP